MSYKMTNTQWHWETRFILWEITDNMCEMTNVKYNNCVIIEIDVIIATLWTMFDGAS